MPNWDSGIYFDGATNGQITNNSVYNSQGSGFWLQSATNNSLSSNNAYNSSKSSFSLDPNSNANTLRGNNAYNSTLDGFYAIGNSNNTLTGNNAYSSLRNGFSLNFNSNRNTLANNSAYNSGDYGFVLYTNSENTLTGNLADSSRSDGFYLRSSSNNLLSNNYASTQNRNGAGFYLDLSTGNSLTNNTAYNNQIGFWLKSSNGNTLRGNTAESNMYEGFFLDIVSNNTLISNTALSNDRDGFSVLTSSNNTLASNMAQANNWTGYRLARRIGQTIGSDYNTLRNNTAQANNNDGFTIQESTGNTIISNKAQSNAHGFSFYSSPSNVLTNNNAYNSTLDGFHLFSSSNNALTNNTAANSGRNDFYFYSGSNNILTNNTAANSGLVGFYLEYSFNNNILTNNTATNSNSDGFSVSSSSNNILTKNTAANSGANGFDFYSSSNNILTNNTATNSNYDGFSVYSSSNNNILTNNTATNSGLNGFDLDSSSNNNILTNNTATNSNSDGFYLYSSSNNIITYNSIQKNQLAQIRVGGASTNNLFHHNNITGSVWVIDNSNDSTNRFDTGADNANALGYEGNIYYFANGTPSWKVYDIQDGNPQNNWADAGAQRPFDNRIREWQGGNRDWHPYVENVTLTCEQSIYPACFNSCAKTNTNCTGIYNYDNLYPNDAKTNCSCECSGNLVELNSPIGYQGAIKDVDRINYQLTGIMYSPPDNPNGPGPVLLIQDYNGLVITEFNATLGKMFTITDSISGNTHSFKVVYSKHDGTNLSTKILFYPPCYKGEVYNETTCQCEPLQNQTCEQSAIPACFGSCPTKGTCAVTAELVRLNVIENGIAQSLPPLRVGDRIRLDSGNYLTVTDIIEHVGGCVGDGACEVTDKQAVFALTGPDAGTWTAKEGDSKILPSTGTNISVLSIGITVSSCLAADRSCLITPDKDVNTSICGCDCPTAGWYNLSVGEAGTIGEFQIRLAEVSFTTNHPAIIDILDMGGQVVGQIQVNPNDTYTFTQPSTGYQIIRVRNTYLFTARDKKAEIWLSGKCKEWEVFNSSTCSCEPLEFTCANAKLNFCWSGACPAAKVCQFEKLDDTSGSECVCGCNETATKLLYDGEIATSPSGLSVRFVEKPIFSPIDPVIFDLLDEKGTLISRISVNTNDIYTYVQASTGARIRVKVLQTTTNWALIQIYPDCPLGKVWNNNTCSCECSNQTAKTECISTGGTWNDTNCSCIMPQYCGKGGDAGFCQKECPISTFTCQANNTSPSGCQCACEQTFSCPIPKSFNNDVCACECPGVAKNIVNISNEISGKNFKIKLVSIDTSVYPPTAKLEVYDMNGQLLWTFDRVKAADNYVPFNGKLNFKVLRISDDGKWAEIVIYKDDCPDNKLYNDATCTCACSQNDKFACESKGGRWNDTNCTCNYNACAMNTSSFTCGGDCAPDQQCEMMEQIGTPEEGSVRICGCVQKCAGAGSADLPIAQMPVQMQNGNYCQDNCPSGTFCSPDKCVCEKPVVLCSKGQRYSNRTCGVDDCPTNQFCEPTSCTCKPLVDTCGPSRNYSKDEPISNRGGSFCSGYCANKAKSCWLYGANGPSDGGYSSWLDADCICECARPQSVEAGYWVGGGMGTGAISPKEFYPDGSARVWLSNLVTDAYPPPETVIREGDIAEYTHPDGGKTYFKIIRIRGNASGGGYISVVSGDCPNGSVYDFTKCACVPVPSIQPWLPVLVQQSSDALHKALSTLAPAASTFVAATLSHPVISTLASPIASTTTPTQPTGTTTTIPTQPTGTTTTPNLTASCSAGNWKSGMQCVNNCPTNYTCNSNCTCIKNAAKNNTSETPITLSVPAGRVGLSATITASGMKSGESVTFTISGTGPKPVTATKSVIASRGQASTFVVCVRKESIPITACVANSRCATAVLQCN